MYYHLYRGYTMWIFFGSVLWAARVNAHPAEIVHQYRAQKNLLCIFHIVTQPASNVVVNLPLRERCQDVRFFLRIFQFAQSFEAQWLLALRGISRAYHYR